MLRRRVCIEGGKKAQTRRPHPVEHDHPLPEEDLGGGDICSLEEEPSTDDDKPLD